MNKILTALLLLFLSPAIIVSQTTSFDAEIVSGANPCGEYVKITLYNTGPISDDVLVTVYKHGQIIQNPYYSIEQSVNVSSNNSTEIILNYFINEIEHRDIIVRVKNALTNMPIAQDITISVPPNYNLGYNCGYNVYYFNLAFEEDGVLQFESISNVPIDVIYPSDTITLLPDQNGFYHGFNIYENSFFKINSTWLAHNNLYQMEPDSVVPFFWNDTVDLTLNPNLYAEPFGDVIIIGCDSCNSIKIKTVELNSGFEFENVIYNYTDPLGVEGFFTASGDFQIFINENEGPFTFSISEQWLESNGLVSTSNSFVVDFTTSNILQFTIPVQCDVNNESDFYFNSIFATPFIAPLELGTVSFNVCDFLCSSNTNPQALVKISYPSFVTPLLDSLVGFNPVVNGDTLALQVNIESNCEFISIPFFFPGTTLEGTIIDFILSVDDVNSNEINISNNTENFFSLVVNSYDPNFKRCQLPTYINPNEKETLKYDIHFQNEGNYMAIKVVLKDTISEHLDLSTFQLIGSKHPVNYSINPSTRIVTFTFDNIFLSPKSESEDDSQGFVTYSIEENENLPLNTEIKNTAYIYFDFNPAIITNTTNNINSNLSLNNPENNLIRIYPNPVKDILKIDVKTVNEINIYDFTGKKIINYLNQNEIDIRALSDGIYLISVITPNGQTTQKLVVNK